MDVFISRSHLIVRLMDMAMILTLNCINEGHFRMISIRYNGCASDMSHNNTRLTFIAHFHMIAD